MLTLPFLDLPLIWAALIAVAVVAYVMLDGFDLGVGILFAAEHDEDDRDVMVNSIAPVWDGNETWLILGGGGLFAVFPLAYGVFMSAMYPTIIAMLLSLVFRGVAFEYRFRAATYRGKRAWDVAFMLGSAGAALCQGLTLGGLLQGVKVTDRAYSGGWFDWLTPFSVLGYALLGTGWLIWRTEGGLQARAKGYAKWLGVATLALIGVVSLWTPLLNPIFTQRWFGWPGILLTSPVPVLIVLLAWRFFVSLKRANDAAPLFCALGWYLLCFVGLGISLFPQMVPPSITIWDAAAPPQSQAFLLVGAAVLIPLILAYNAYAYWVFRGKVRVGAHTH
jgi:cytochrome d ubiquinol oxidase subunit II